jgi:hypothetical protein
MQRIEEENNSLIEVDISYGKNYSSYQFSDSSRNALEYACKFLDNPTTSVLLLNIFSFPGSLTGDAIAIAAMSETIAER